MSLADPIERDLGDMVCEEQREPSPRREPVHEDDPVSRLLFPPETGQVGGAGGEGNPMVADGPRTVQAPKPHLLGPERQVVILVFVSAVEFREQADLFVHPAPHQDHAAADHIEGLRFGVFSRLHHGRRNLQVDRAVQTVELLKESIRPGTRVEIL